jgi:hypothetical protein
MAAKERKERKTNREWTRMNANRRQRNRRFARMGPLWTAAFPRPRDEAEARSALKSVA